MKRFKTDPANILRSVDIVFQVMVKAAHRWDGLFPAVAERHHGNLLMDFPLPPIIPGQRNSDRSPRGCNLAHDLGLLECLHGLDATLGRPERRRLFDNYLQTFATECAPASPTGLLPWGEHAYWKLTDGSIGNSYLLQYAEQPLDAGIPTHHQLGTMSPRLWERIHAANPEALPRFVNGLDWHWMNEDRTLFNRHAPITQFIRGYQNKRHSKMTGEPLDSLKGSDFPGSSGVFIHDFACALALVEQPDPAWKAGLLRFANSWWERRLPSGICPKSGGQVDAGRGGALNQTTDLALSLAEAGSLLLAVDPELGQTLRQQATAYAEAVFAFPQDQAEEGRLTTMLAADGRAIEATQLWSGNRGNSITAQYAVKWLKLAEAVKIEAPLPKLTPALEHYLTSFLPRDQIVRARDPANVIAVTTEMARITGEDRWMEAALLHATEALELYFDCPLPRMSTGRSHYEAQQGSGDLVHALARLALLADGKIPRGGLAGAIA